MDTDSTPNSDPRKPVLSDLPVPSDQASAVKGGTLYSSACKGKHLPEVVIE